MFVFSITENWVEPRKNQEHLHYFFVQIREQYETRYYKTLFHLLTCPFCLAKSSILRKNTVPDLWKISLADFTLSSESASYVQLLYEKLYNNNVVFIFSRGTWSEQVIPQIKAAGISQGFPPCIAVPQTLFEEYGDVSFNFTIVKEQRCMEISIEGGSFQTRCRLKLKIMYSDGSTLLLHGRDIAMAGSWTTEKINGISRVEIVFEDQ